VVEKGSVITAPNLAAELADLPVEQPLTEASELLDCLRKIGRGLIASGSSVGVVENTLIGIANTYGMACEIAALPNVILIKLGQTSQGVVDFTVQRLTSLKLDQVSELMQLIDKVRRKLIQPREAVSQLDRIQARSHRFSSAAIVFGYLLSCVGLTLLHQPQLRSLAVTGAAGILVGTMVLWFQRRPHFALLLPVIAAAVVSTLMFMLAQNDVIYGATTLIVPPLATFLPGAVLTTGMIELASAHILSGSARLMYGAATLILLYIGIAVGLSISGSSRTYVYAFEPSAFPWWAPLLGTLLFGIGTFIRLSGANSDLFWMLLVLYIAMVSQFLGERLVSTYFGAFLGATLMTLTAELIARSPRRTPAQAAQMLAFWFLVPGARGLLGVTSILGKDFQSAMIGIGQMLGLMGAIALGVLLGTLVVSSRMFVTAATYAGQIKNRTA
jgi:uncharacterized membrane protein YjjP (DUF1212 family)